MIGCDAPACNIILIISSNELNGCRLFVPSIGPPSYVWVARSIRSDGSRLALERVPIYFDGSGWPGIASPRLV